MRVCYKPGVCESPANPQSVFQAVCIVSSWLNYAFINLFMHTSLIFFLLIYGIIRIQKLISQSEENPRFQILISLEIISEHR